MSRRRGAVCLLAALLSAALGGCRGDGSGTEGAPAAADAGPAAAAGPAASSGATTAAAAPPAGEARVPSPPRPLTADAPPLTRPLRADEVHLYDLDLPAGLLTEVEVEQLGADVELRLFDASGARLLAVDRPTGGEGEEILPWIAASPGRYRLEVETWDDPRAAVGQYAIRMHPPRPASGEDRDWVAGEQAYDRARMLRGSDLAAAETAFARAAELFAAAGRPVRRAEAVRGIAFARHHRRDEAGHEAEWYLEPWERAAELYRQANDTLGAARMLAHRAEELTDRGRRRDAEVEWQRVIALTSGNPEWQPQLAVAHHNLGILLAEGGEAERALEHLEAAVELGRDPAQTAIALRLLGFEYFDLGLTEPALDRLQRALAICRREKDPDGEARTLTRLAWVLAARDRLDDAEAALRRALEVWRQLGDRYGEAVTLSFAHEVAVKRGDLAAARRDLDQALAIFQADDEDGEAAVVLSSLGWLEIAVGRPLQARQRFEQALPGLRDLGNPREEANALLGLGLAQADGGEVETGLRTVESSIAMVERLRRGVSGRSLRSHQLAHRYGHYDVHIELLMRLDDAYPGRGWAQRAFAAFEQARARALLDNLVAAGPSRAAQLDPGDGEGRRLAAQIEAIESDLEALERERSGLVWQGGPAPKIRAVERHLADRELEWQRLEGRLRARMRDGEPRPLDLEQVRDRVLDDDSLLLAYHLGRERSFLWVVGRHLFASYELPPREVVETAARHAHDRVADSHRHTARVQAERAMRNLSDLLLAPAAEHLRGDQRLLVVADGALLYVSFAALPVPAGDRRPLIAAHEVVSLPSASALAALRRRVAAREPAKGVVAVLADPVFQPDDPRITGTPPPAWQDALRRSGESFQRLRFAHREAESILALAPPGPRFEAFGFDADYDTVVSGALSGYRFVHLATHARIYADRPAASGIVLSRLDRDGAPRAVEMLRSRDVYRLGLSADLVTLSACGTALGEEVRGEGLEGFTQAFFSAGAARVLVSLWEVGDDSTAELMERFYRHLFVDGMSPAAALRAAQVSMWREERWRAPYHWGAFVLQGEPR